MNTEKVYKVMDSALEQYRLDKSDLNFGRAQGAAKLALELSFITADQFVVYMESLIWERNNPSYRGAECPELTSSKFQNLPFLITSSPWISKRELLAIPQGCGTNNFDFIFYMVYK